jgi:hypothetical protein
MQALAQCGLEAGFNNHDEKILEKDIAGFLS